MKGRFSSTAACIAFDQAFAHRHAERAAQEIERLHRDHHRQAVDACRARRYSASWRPVLARASFSRRCSVFSSRKRSGSAGTSGGDQFLEGAGIEDRGEALRRADAHVMAALRADELRRHQVAVEDHLAAGRDISSRDSPACRRPRVRPIRLLIRGRTKLAIQFMRSLYHGFGPRRMHGIGQLGAEFQTTSLYQPLPAAGRSAIRATMAEPTTAPSAKRAISAACSGVLMPKPTAQGRSVAALQPRHGLAHVVFRRSSWCRSRRPPRRNKENRRRRRARSSSRVVVGCRRGKPDDVEALGRGGHAQHFVFFRRQIDGDQPVDAGVRGIAWRSAPCRRHGSGL